MSSLVLSVCIFLPTGVTCKVDLIYSCGDACNINILGQDGHGGGEGLSLGGGREDVPDTEVLGQRGGEGLSLGGGREDVPDTEVLGQSGGKELSLGGGREDVPDTEVLSQRGREGLSLGGAREDVPDTEVLGPGGGEGLSLGGGIESMYLIQKSLVRVGERDSVYVAVERMY